MRLANSSFIDKQNVNKKSERIMRKLFIYFLILNFVSPVAISKAEDARFIGNLVLADFDESEGYKFRLVEPFEYLDPNGLRWRAEIGTVTDGASIPRALWTIVGSPYTGYYRKAAIIHDFYCDKQHRYRRWENVHRVFYDAMITAGVSKPQALLMYYAVWRFGPRWRIEEITNCRPGHVCFDNSLKQSIVTTTRPIVDKTNKEEIEAELNNIKSRLKIENLELSDITTLASQQKSVKSSSAKIVFDDKTADGRKFLQNLQAQ